MRNPAVRRKALNVYRVSNAWVVEAHESRFVLDLDFLGTSVGAKQVEATASEFALLSTIMAQGKPAYYSTDLRAISTDPFFGNSAKDAPPSTALLVTDADVVWSFAEKKGRLLLEMENRSFTSTEVNDAAALAA